MPFCSYHFVRYHFVRSPLEVVSRMPTSEATFTGSRGVTCIVVNMLTHDAGGPELAPRTPVRLTKSFTRKAAAFVKLHV